MSQPATPAAGAPFAPALSRPAMAVVRHLAQGRQVRLSRWGVRKYEVFDPSTGATKTSWEVSYSALCELLLHRVLVSAQDLSITEAARDWVSSQAPPPRIDHTSCDHPATEYAVKSCRKRQTQPAVGSFRRTLRPGGGWAQG